MIDVVVPLSVSVDEDVGLTVSGGADVSVGVDTTITASIVDHYEGPVTVTPSDQEQTLLTAGLMVDEDVVIQPVPNTYGRILWDGVALMVY